jgi:arylsulfatase A
MDSKVTIHRRSFLKMTLGTLVAGQVYHQCQPLFAAESLSKQPNFIVIFLDDLGYGDLGCFGHPTIRTPNIDRMAREGAKLTQFYSSASVCSPSRAALLTGRLPIRTTVTGVLFPNQNTGLPTTEVTIAKALKESHYATACIGKWHLGHLKRFLPTSHGFDSYFGIPYSNDMSIDPKMDVAKDVVFRQEMTLDKMRNTEPQKHWVPLLRNEEIIEYPADQTTLTKRYTQQAVQYIRDNKSKPFFLYLAHTMPHIPLFASDPYKDRSLRGLYGDTVEEIDASVGVILDELKQQGIDNNTLVIFTSDNGPWLSVNLNGGSSGPLRGGKFTTWEGGFREPCIIRWPGIIEANSVKTGIASTLDIFPTILDFAGLKVPGERRIDGYSLKRFLTENAPSPRDMIFYYSGKTLAAVRWKEWKLHIKIPNSELKSEYQETQQPLLFNIEQDVSEKHDLASQYPDIIREIQTRIAKHQLTL